MEEIQQLLETAADNLSSGNVKDAYFSYISALNLASKELQSIKFINNVVTSKPSSINSVFTISRKCLTYAEDIILKHQPLSPSRKNPNLNIAIYPPTPQEEHSFDQITAQKAPRIPPKPARRSMTKSKDDEEFLVTSPKNETSLSPQFSKPPLPPKPSRTGSLKKYFRDVEVSGMGRDAQILPPDKELENVSEVENFDVDAYRRKSDESLNISTAPILLRRSSSPNLSVKTNRRISTLPGSLTDSPTDEENYSSHIISPSSRFHLFAPFRMTLHDSITNLLPFERRHDIISVVPEGAVDPNNLVEANVLNETENSHSPNSPSHSYSDHIPQIPVSPLLTQHSQLEQKIQSLEVKLTEYRNILKARRAGETDHSELSDDEINDALLKYGASLASSKEAITRNRKLYFKAAADPNILDFAPHMVAYQLTLIDSAIFLEIDPLSLLTHSPKHPDPKITASTDFFNYLTRVIESSILSPQEASARALVIHYWVKVAIKLHELHNYQTLKGILSALGTPPIKRLKRTWACIPKKSMTKLDSLNELMSESSNYGKYRETLQQEKFTRKPVIPFLGPFIMDATYLLAAVQSSGSVTPNSSTYQNPITPGLASSGNSTVQDDPRVQELLQSMKRYQTGPKYSSKPPASYIKASTKHHFRTASISAALHRGGNKLHLRHDEDNETVEEQQQFLTHYLLTRHWMPEKLVDELSKLREPQKHKSMNGSSNSQRNSANGGTWNGISIISNSSNKLRESTGSTAGGSGTSTGGNGSTSSGRGRTSSTSGSGESRPNSLGEGSEVNSSSSIVTRLEKAIPMLEKDRENGNGSGGTRDEKEKRHEKSKNEEFEKDNDKIEFSKEKESNISNPNVEVLTNPVSTKRTSWKTGAMRVMFGGSEPAAELPKSPSSSVKTNNDSNLALSPSRSSSGNERGSPKSPNKAHIRTLSSVSPIVKQFPFSSVPPAARRSMDESRSTTPPPLLPKPAGLLHRSASTSSVSSRGSNSSISNGNLASIIFGSTLTSPTASINIITTGTNTRKVAGEVVAASSGGTLEKNRE
ncbi:1761_t:CDS:2 [Ambispora leptoticha]|uniref:1761_t:CDS:1 n=1 Tax=Ambispora leptoticha TaxID=144679 RepID=A0A9N8V7X5_9GLOM|nr:1761_t:CDS:2 [Ambispora leptoticha]